MKTHKLAMAILLAVFMTMAACTPKSEQTGKNVQEIKKATAQFTDNKKVLKNPLMGWTINYSVDEVIAYGIPAGYDSIVLRATWDEMEPEEGKFNWEKLDMATKICKDADVSIIMPLYLQASDVYHFTGIPNWIWTKYNIPYQIVNNSSFEVLYREDFPTKHPVYDNKVYQEKVLNFLKAFSAKYPDGTWDILEIRLYGIYGEWDSGWNRFDWGGDRDLKSKTLGELINLYLEAFQNYNITKLSMDMGYELGTREQYEDYKTEARHDIALEHKFAIRSCGIGAGDLSGYTKYIVEDVFPNAPIHAETWYGWEPETHDVNATLNAFYQAHVNYMTFGMCYPSAEIIRMENLPMFNDALKRMGYRLLPKKIEYPEAVTVETPFEITSLWTNSGCGVCYRKYPIKYSLKDDKGNVVWYAVDENFDQTKWIKGKEYQFTSKLAIPETLKKKGKFGLYISLIDNEGKAKIALPISTKDPKDSKGREYKVCEIEIR